MDLFESLKKNNIIIKPGAKNRWEILEEMVDLAAKNKDIPAEDAEDIKKSLIEREKSMSTGIGNGVAMPHCSTSKISNVVSVMALISKGLAFDTIDNEPVKIIILLIIPKDKLSLHIKTLANTAKLMNNAELREKLLGITKPEAILKMLKQYTPE